jgi:hypothetical protein
MQQSKTGRTLVRSSPGFSGLPRLGHGYTQRLAYTLRSVRSCFHVGFFVGFFEVSFGFGSWDRLDMATRSVFRVRMASACARQILATALRFSDLPFSACNLIPCPFVTEYVPCEFCITILAQSGNLHNNCRSQSNDATSGFHAWV